MTDSIANPQPLGGYTPTPDEIAEMERQRNAPAVDTTGTHVLIENNEVVDVVNGYAEGYVKLEANIGDKVSLSPDNEYVLNLAPTENHIYQGGYWVEDATKVKEAKLKENEELVSQFSKKVDKLSKGLRTKTPTETKELIHAQLMLDRLDDVRKHLEGL